MDQNFIILLNFACNAISTNNRLCGACYDTTTDHDAIRMRYLDDDNKIEISTPIDTLDAWNWWIWWLSPLRWLFIRTINIFITSVSWHMCSLFRKQDREWLTYFIIIYCCFTIYIFTQKIMIMHHQVSES